MIQFAKKSDIEDIMSFIDTEWKKNHILARDRAFFEYMYVLGEQVNFVISRDESCQVNGILGFIPYDRECKQVSLTMWKALASSEGMVGMGMLNALLKEIQPEVIASPGINPQTTIPLYRFLKFETGKMKHYFRLNKCEEYNIAMVKDGGEIADVPDEGNVFELYSYDEFLQLQIKYESNALKKEEWYIKKRYFEHPVYKYRFFCVKEEENSLIIVAREEYVGQAVCLRMVDLLGKHSLLSKATKFLDHEMKKEKYEYLDCYVAGIKDAVFRDAGWENCEERDVIIPNYFAPFERTNIDVYYCSKPGGTVLFRGDGDQDRPN